MAGKQGDSESGRLGDKILYTWHGRQCERSMPTSVANPQTEAQWADMNGDGIPDYIWNAGDGRIGVRYSRLGETNRLYTVADERYYSYYAYDHTGQRTLKMTGDAWDVDQNAWKSVYPSCRLRLE